MPKESHSLQSKDWKTINGTHIGFSNDGNIIAPKFYKDYKKSQGWVEPKNGINKHGKPVAIRHSESRIEKPDHGTLTIVKPLSKTLTLDFYYTRPNGHSDKVTLNTVDNDFFSAKLAFNNWNEANDATVTKITLHDSHDQIPDWLKEIEYPIEFPTYTLIFNDTDIPLNRLYWNGDSWLRVHFIQDSHGVTIQERNNNDWIIDAKIYPGLGKGLHKNNTKLDSYKDLLIEAIELGIISEDMRKEQLDEFKASRYPEKHYEFLLKKIKEKKSDIEEARSLTLSEKEREEAQNLSWDELLNKNICPICTHRLKDEKCWIHGTKPQINPYKEYYARIAKAEKRRNKKIKKKMDK